MDNPKETQVLNKSLGIRIATGVGILVVLALAANLIWAAASAGVGLALLGAMGLVATGVVRALPYLGQKWENKVLAARKAEARKNPIEQLQNFLMEKQQRVALFRDAVSSIGSQIKSLEDMVANRKRTKPNFDASSQEKTLQTMRAAHATLMDKYRAAESALGQLKEVIEDKQFDWKFAQAGQAAIQSLNATSGEDLMNQILADEAFSSVRDNFNKVFSDLEMEAAKLSDAKQLTFGSGDQMTLDISAIHIPAPVAR